MPDLAPGELRGDGGQRVLQPDMSRQHVEVCATHRPVGRAACLCFNGVLVLFLSRACGCSGDLSVASFQSKFVV